MVGKAGRENDQTSGDSYEGIQHHDADRLAQQGVLLADIAAEDGHGTDAKAEGEERLIHSGDQRVDHAHFLHPVKVRHKEERKPFLCPGHEQAVDSQHHHNEEQGNHHALGHTLQTTLQTLGAHQNAHYHHEYHPEGHGGGAGQHFGKLTSYLLCVEPCQLAGGSHVEIVQHPARYGGVEHHQQVAADEGKVAVDVPLLPRLFQRLIRPHRAFAGGASHGKLHGHDGQTQNDQKDQVEQYKSTAAALTGDIRELPHIADADGAACGKQNKAKTGFQSFSFHDPITPYFCFRGAFLPTGPRGRRSAALDCWAALRVCARPLTAAARRPFTSALVSSR